MFQGWFLLLFRLFAVFCLGVSGFIFYNYSEFFLKKA
jgi:hypothetical protein